jgi:hypothetical protein
MPAFRGHDTGWIGGLRKTMCLACDEANYFYRFYLVEQIAKGVMPEGHTAESLREMGLPLPGEIETEVQPDGTLLYRQKARAPSVAPSAKNPAGAFACDSPDGE